MNNLFVLKLLLAGVFFIGLLSLQAQVVVSGIVTDQNGGALPGASILIKGSTSGTITDLDGYYSLTTTISNPVLIYSFIGFQEHEQAINISESGTAKINVVLYERGTIRLKRKKKNNQKNTSDEAGADILKFEIMKPFLENNVAEVYDQEIEISVRISGSKKPLQKVWINGMESVFDNEGFASRTISLQEGENTVFVRAEDKKGNFGMNSFIIKYLKP